MDDQKTDLHIATWADLPVFIQLWNRFLADEYSRGGLILPTEENTREFVRIFQAYTQGSLFGFCVVASRGGVPVGLLMAGENFPGGAAFETVTGKCAILWGVYVEPEYRRQGVSWLLHEKALIYANELGFDSTISEVLLGDEAAEPNAFHWGATRHATVIKVNLQDRINA